MKIFQCGNCNHPLFFENNKCENCGHLCGYRDVDRMMLTFNPSSKLLISDREKLEYRYCKNKEYDVCNWLVEQGSTNAYCRACQLNRTIPNLSDGENFDKWRNLEIAKHRLVYQLQKIGLKLISKMSSDDGMCFDFIAQHNNPNIMTGHANGVITILVKEADAAVREQLRKELMEPYRTLIGHLRHEVGHYFWEQLVMNNDRVIVEFREIFGNEQQSYAEALKKYYRDGAPINWQDSFISKYATAHPWEDWAETWAHYLHIMDMVETSHFFGLRVSPMDILKDFKRKISYDPYQMEDFHVIIDTCIPLSLAVNSINRAMGIPDVYPFAVTPNVIQKMKFIHQLLLSNRQ